MHSVFTIADDPEDTGRILLAGLAPASTGGPSVLSATWEAESTSWFSTWYVKLTSASGLVANLRLGPLYPTQGHTYEAVLSYHPLLGYLSFALLDKTDAPATKTDALAGKSGGKQISSGSWRVNQYAGAIYGVADKGAAIATYPWYEPIGVEWDIGTGVHGDFTPMRLLEPQGDNWVRIMALGALPGEYQVLTASGKQLARRSGNELSEGENWLPITNSELPLGTAELTLQYSEQGQPKVSDTRSIVVGKVDASLGRVTINSATHRFESSITLRSQSVLPGVALRLQANISSIAWNATTSSYTPKSHSVVDVDLGRLPTIPAGDIVLPISFAVPDQPGLWQVVFNLQAEPSIITEVTIPAIQFSTYNWTVLGNETLSVTTDHRDALYHVGETVQFTMRVTQNGQPMDGVSVQWSLVKDGGAILQSGVTQLQNGEAHVTASLDKPGFMQLRATYMSGAQALTATVGAGVDPLKITPSMPVPDDFDAFWAEKKALLAAVPMKSQVVPVGTGDPSVVAYDVKVDALGAPVSGYLAMPAHAKPGSLPAILTFHGSGVDGAILSRSTAWANDGLLAFDINAHGILNGQPAAYYSALESGELAGYRLQGRESRDSFYFLGMFLRVIRAIDYLTSRPEWDGRTLILYGTSQGAAQAYAGAALDARVTFLAAGVAAMSDLAGTEPDRPIGWPGAALTAGVSPEARARIMNTVRYFDTANFATRVQADGIFAVGFVDTTCPPTTVYAAYNNVQSKNKAMHNDIATGHVNTPEAVRVMRGAVLDHVASMKR